CLPGHGDRLSVPTRRSSDLPAVFTQTELNDYIYGSAEVVGLMCLAVFESGMNRVKDERGRLESGARSLGAAFQKVNFLRDFVGEDRKSTRLNSSHVKISYAV